MSKFQRTAKMSLYWGKICDRELKIAQSVRGVQNCVFFKAPQAREKIGIFLALLYFFLISAPSSVTADTCDLSAVRQGL